MSADARLRRFRKRVWVVTWKSGSGFREYLQNERLGREREHSDDVHAEQYHGKSNGQLLNITFSCVLFKFYSYFFLGEHFPCPQRGELDLENATSLPTFWLLRVRILATHNLQGAYCIPSLRIFRKPLPHSLLSSFTLSHSTQPTDPSVTDSQSITDCQ